MSLNPLVFLDGGKVAIRDARASGEGRLTGRLGWITKGGDERWTWRDE
jgi:hypothetical protein